MRVRLRVGDGDESSSMNGSLLVKMDNDGRLMGREGRADRVGVSNAIEEADEVEELNKDLALLGDT